MAVRIRYFAAAKSALGLAEEQRPGERSVADILADALAEHAPANADAADVIARCTFLVDAVSTTDPATHLPDGSTLDVLPPFAGG